MYEFISTKRSRGGIYGFAAYMDIERSPKRLTQMYKKHSEKKNKIISDYISIQ